MDSKLEIVPSRVAAQIGELPTKVLNMARLCDGTRDLQALCAAAKLPAEEVAPIVERLVALGVVQKSATRKPRPLSDQALAWAHGKAQSFSDDEEEFFASPVALEDI
jgi:hypothetical protein